MRRQDLHHHMDQFIVIHAHLQAEFDMCLKKDQDSILRETQQLIERVANVDERLTGAEKSLDSLESRLDILETDRRERHSER